MNLPSRFSAIILSCSLGKVLKQACLFPVASSNTMINKLGFSLYTCNYITCFHLFIADRLGPLFNYKIIVIVMRMMSSKSIGYEPWHFIVQLRIHHQLLVISCTF